MTSPYSPVSEEKIKDIALGIFQGRIFHSGMIRPEDNELLGSIFMPLLFMNDEVRKWFLDYNIVFFYEEYRDASPTCVNGYPTFVSLHYLNDEDSKRVMEKLDKLRDITEEL